MYILGNYEDKDRKHHNEMMMMMMIMIIIIIIIIIIITIFHRLHSPMKTSVYQPTTSTTFTYAQI